MAGQGDFALANRLYRDRNSLSSAALAHLALALRPWTARRRPKEILGLLEKRNLDDAATRRDAALGVLPWSSSPAELRALYALAIEEVTPKSPKAKELVDWLMAHRTGNRWSPEKATGPAALALCRWFADSRFTGERYKLTVFVNDVQVKVLDVDPAARQPDDRRAAAGSSSRARRAKQRVNFQIAGRGRYTYQCILGGFVPADKLKSTTGGWRVDALLRAGPAGARRPRDPPRLRRAGRRLQTFRNP